MSIQNKPGPENIRMGAPYDQPAFEALCRAHDIWGTASAALCAVFWRAAGTQPYDQQALEPCTVCGWKTLIPGDGCLNCDRQANAPAARRPMNAAQVDTLICGICLYSTNTYAEAVVRATEKYHGIPGDAA